MALLLFDSMTYTQLVLFLNGFLILIPRNFQFSISILIHSFSKNNIITGTGSKIVSLSNYTWGFYDDDMSSSLQKHLKLYKTI